jgi:hypothetical protein
VLIAGAGSETSGGAFDARVVADGSGSEPSAHAASVVRAGSDRLGIAPSNASARGGDGSAVAAPSGWIADGTSRGVAGVVGSGGLASVCESGFGGVVWFRREALSIPADPFGAAPFPMPFGFFGFFVVISARLDE